MRDERTSTILRGVEPIAWCGAGRSLLSNVGGKASYTRKHIKKIDVSHAATLSLFVAPGGLSDTRRPCRGGCRTTAPLWHARRELRLRSVRLLLVLTQKNLQDELAKYVRERVRPLYVVRFNHVASRIVNANHIIM